MPETGSSGRGKGLAESQIVTAWKYPPCPFINGGVMWIRWVIFLHVLGALTFFLGHGASAAMVFRLRHETNLERIRALLDLSSSTLLIYTMAFLVMGITGLILPFALDLWGEGWIWASIVLILFTAVYMTVFNRRSYNLVRKMAGMPYMEGNKPADPVPAAPADEVVAFIRQIKLGGVVFIGYVIPGFVLWLMFFKPF
jgi:hypothetical protein